MNYNSYFQVQFSFTFIYINRLTDKTILIQRKLCCLLLNQAWFR